MEFVSKKIFSKTNSDLFSRTRIKKSIWIEFADCKIQKAHGPYKRKVLQNYKSKPLSLRRYAT